MSDILTLLQKLARMEACDNFYRWEWDEIELTAFRFRGNELDEPWGYREFSGGSAKKLWIQIETMLTESGIKTFQLHWDKDRLYSRKKKTSQTT